jgi:hypothetical protein
MRFLKKTTVKFPFSICNPSSKPHILISLPKAADRRKSVKNLLKIGAALTVVLAFAAIAMGQDVRTDYDKHASFENYHTYYWEKVQTSNQLWESRIRDAVDRDLQAKGWQKVQSGADVAVTAVGSSRNQQEYQTFYDGLGGWRWGGFGETTTTVENYRVGTLVLDMYDTHNKQLIWRGVSSNTLSDKPEKNEKSLDKSVDKMLKDFPPKGAQ